MAEKGPKYKFAVVLFSFRSQKYALGCIWERKGVKKRRPPENGQHSLLFLIKKQTGLELGNRNTPLRPLRQSSWRSKGAFWNEKVSKKHRPEKMGCTPCCFLGKKQTGLELGNQNTPLRPQSQSTWRSKGAFWNEKVSKNTAPKKWAALPAVY